MRLVMELTCLLLADPAAAPEGPTAAPTALLLRQDPVWQARRQRLKIGTSVAGSLLGLSVLGLGITSARLGDPDAVRVRARDLQILSATTAVLSGLAVILVGAAWERHEQLGARRWRTGDDDPQHDLAWVQRNKRLTGWWIGTGVVTGVLITATVGTTIPFLRPCPTSGFEDCGLADPIAPLYLSIASLVGLASFATLGIVRAVHRAPLRAWRVRLTGAGLQLKF